MRKKFILVDALSALFSLIILLALSCFIVYNENYKAYSNEAINYLSLTCSIFDGSNIEETSDALKNTKSDIRLTIIDLNGNVIYDSNNKEVSKNHLDRPEIQNLNTVFSRYSETEGKDMLYIADIDDGYYLRVSFSMGDVNKTIYQFTLFGILLLILIEGIVVFLSFYFSNKSLEPVNKNLAKIAYLAKIDLNYEEINIDNLPSIIDQLSKLIDGQIEHIESQKKDMRTIINLLNQGVLALDDEGYVVFINSEAKIEFNENEDFENKKYVYLIRDLNLQKEIENSLNNHCSSVLNINLNNKIFNVMITPINQNWLKGGLIVSLNDITQDEKLKKIKKDFFDNASHELKSPITSIVGYSQMISKGIVDDKNEIVEYSNRILKEANRMNSIIYDMLNIAEIEKDYALNIANINLKDLILDNIKSLSSLAKEKNVIIETDLERLFVKSDARLVDELIRNLLDNSIKYNKDNGKVKVILKDNYLEIKDTGIGIAKSDIGRIFERFYRVDKVRSKESGGTGLGLSIVKHIVETCNFKIEVNSTLGVGSTFKVTFN